MDIMLQKLQMEMAIKEMVKMMPEQIQLCKLVAEQQKIYFDELVKQGFTENQALEIVKVHGIDTGRISKMNGTQNE
ncbi:hypothetical protein [Marinisporobacter balticus]|uniref:Uncharacterized protein n=1 Tax=Marinisporobacter balticus TaxID=2018667 RepID=A0A4R2KBC3_9FIRM|nr:hypothetical protein [Marinisporobacter balticus]TCO69522.1 hypothetical protein EV214_13146 [Marinisporobacter balticus]